MLTSKDRVKFTSTTHNFQLQVNVKDNMWDNVLNNNSSGDLGGKIHQKIVSIVWPIETGRAPQIYTNDIKVLLSANFWEP